MKQYFVKWVVAITVGTSIVSCNKDDVIYVDPGKTGNTGTMSPSDEETDDAPSIKWIDETGIFATKIGREITITPLIENADDATIEWKENGQLLSIEPQLTWTWNEDGKHFVEITVTNSAGQAYDEIRVDVADLIPPSISLPLANGEYVARVGSTVIIEAAVANPFNEEYSIEWSMGDVILSTESRLEYKAEFPGEFPVTVHASNNDGESSLQFTLKIVESMPESVYFPPVSYNVTSTERYTFPGRSIYLKPRLNGIDGNDFKWAVNGSLSENSESSFIFTPATPGNYEIGVVVNGKCMASVTVVCVDSNESARIRRAGNSSSPLSTKVFEYVPAPGQFIGETQVGGFTGTENTHELAVKWAEDRLKKNSYVSLGAWGGYIVVGFDHSITSGSGQYDFAIQGNAFFNAGTEKGGSNEPGIVYVMQDVNGNGLPDDEWFELRGSETGSANTYQDYEVTYYRPVAPRMPVQWTDNYGNTGSIDYLINFHRQDFYYPQWIIADSYTLRGTRLTDHTTQDPTTGFWDNSCFAWGYADNMGNDNLDGADAVTGAGQRNGFKIANAMLPDGTPVQLQYIDFIKVQTGVQSKAGWLGEVSTEVFGFTDLSL